MKRIFFALTCLFTTTFIFAQVDNPNKVIKLDPNVHLISELKLDHNKEYGLKAKDIQDLFPSLVKEKRVNERFGKNAYRTKVIKVIDEKALIPVMAASIKKQDVAVDILKSKLVTIEKEM
ncbi:hypothetical protein [Niabella digestorum]|jgi:hypothetical protein|uniref:Tail fiber domain-containing protein n=1 Tax=Niabella digestorum TaxID=3117701 RepID=A0ABU7RG51_9BACT